MHDRLNLVEDNLLYMIILPSKIMKKKVLSDMSNSFLKTYTYLILDNPNITINKSKQNISTSTRKNLVSSI